MINTTTKVVMMMVSMFLLTGYTIETDVTGGSGTLTASTGGFDCEVNEPTTDPDCYEDYNSPTTVTFHAQPWQGYEFVKWESDSDQCAIEPSLNECTVDATSSLSVTATFRQKRLPIQAATYTYNALGQRITKTVAGVTTIFQYDMEGRLLGEFDSAGQPMMQYVHLDDMPVAQIRTESGGSFTTDYMHTDHLGSPQLITDGSQAILAGIESTPFGDTYIDFELVPNSMRMPGQYKDDETALHYNYFRNYDPIHGRYIESDPIGLQGGLNTYAYVGNRPLSFVDPTGEIPLIVIIPLVGGAAGAFWEAIGAAQCGNNDPLDIAAAAGRGFLAGAAGTAAGIALRNPYAGGAVAGGVSDAVNSLAQGRAPTIESVGTGAAIGAVSAGIGAKAFPTKGRKPFLTKNRNSTNWGLNSDRLVGQAATGGAVGGSLGALGKAAGPGCGCDP